MRRFCVWFAVVFLAVSAGSAAAASGKIAKVLPHHLDAKGRNAISPSLFDRDAYQAHLQKNPDLRAGIRYDIQWRARSATGEVKLRLELRGLAQGKEVRTRTLERVVDPGKGSARWTDLALTGDDFKVFGEVTAWRVTLWDGETQLAEQKSFLW